MTRDEEAEFNRLKIENAALLRTVQVFAGFRPDLMSPERMFCMIERAREQLRLALKQKTPFREPDDILERQASFIQNTLHQMGEPFSPVVIRRAGTRVYEAWVEGCEKVIGYADGASAREAIIGLYTLTRRTAEDRWARR